MLRLRRRRWNANPIAAFRGDDAIESLMGHHASGRKSQESSSGGLANEFIG